MRITVTLENSDKEEKQAYDGVIEAHWKNIEDREEALEVFFALGKKLFYGE